MSVASMSGTTTYSATHSQASTTVTVTDLSRQSHISNNSDAQNANHLVAAPPALDTVSESGNSMKFEDLNDILSKTHSARHAKDGQSKHQANESKENKEEVPSEAASSVTVGSDSEGNESVKSGKRGHDVKSSLQKVDETQNKRFVCLLQKLCCLFCLRFFVCVSAPIKKACEQ